jgi:hypothetical protein
MELFRETKYFNKMRDNMPLKVGRLIIYCSTVLRPAKEFFTYMETSSLPVKGCKI